MSEIERVFRQCRRERRAAFIPFLVAGDPDLDTTADLLDALVAGGADLIEVGVPFSDPIADGPVIQRAATRALLRGVTLSKVLALVAAKRSSLGVPIVLFSYFNPLQVRGAELFAEQAAASGVDGVLCVDLPPEQGDLLAPALTRQGLDTVFLLSPTSGPERVEKVARAASGFVYYVSVTGITGERRRVSKDLGKTVKKLRKKLDLPVAVGFGISTTEQVAEVAAMADGVVVGSALVRFVEEHAGHPRLARLLEEKVRELAAPLRG